MSSDLRSSHISEQSELLSVAPIANAKSLIINENGKNRMFEVLVIKYVTTSILYQTLNHIDYTSNETH